MPCRPLLVLCAALLVCGGCSSTRQVRTAAPRVLPASTASVNPAGAGAGLVVRFETGEMALPDGVEALRFRVAALQLRQADGTWATYPADANTFEVRREAAAVRKTVLVTQLPPVAYDSLAVTLSHLYVAYGPDAGGPLTQPHDRPTRLPFAFTPAPGRPAALRLTLEPGASLSRAPDCRWFFLPFLRAALDENR